MGAVARQPGTAGRCGSALSGGSQHWRRDAPQQIYYVRQQPAVHQAFTESSLACTQQTSRMENAMQTVQEHQRPAAPGRNTQGNGARRRGSSRTCIGHHTDGLRYSLDASPPSQRWVRQVPCRSVAQRRLLALCRHWLGGDGEARERGDWLGNWSAGIASCHRHARSWCRHARRTARRAAGPAAAGHTRCHGCHGWGGAHRGGQLAGGWRRGGALQAKGVGSRQ